MGAWIETDCYLLVVEVEYVFKERELQLISKEKRYGRVKMGWKVRRELANPVVKNNSIDRIALSDKQWWQINFKDRSLGLDFGIPWIPEEEMNGGNEHKYSNIFGLESDIKSTAFQKH